jgi:hypothetical protein
VADAILIALGCAAVAGTVFAVTAAAIMIPVVISTHWSPIWRTPSRR